MSDLYTITGEMLQAARDVDAMGGRITQPYDYYARIYEAMREIEPPTPELRDVPFKTPNGVIVLDSQLSEGMARRLKAEWEKKYTKGDSLCELFDRLLNRSKKSLVFDGHGRPHSAVAVKISDVNALREIVHACVVSLLGETEAAEAALRERILKEGANRQLQVTK